jgi:hypothetical protein
LYLATKKTIRRLKPIRIKRLARTVPTYTAIPISASIPNLRVNFVKSPKTAIGARDILHFTTVMQIACIEFRKLIIGVDWLFSKETRAIPTITPIITT